MKLSKREERVWRALVEDRTRGVETLAEMSDTSTEFVEALLARISSPDWRDPAPSLSRAEHPDTNPKTALGEAKPKISSTPTIAIREMGKVFELGAKKYGRFNWREHKVSSTVYYDAAWRHMAAWFEGEDVDPESGVSHLAHVMACMAILIDAQDKNSLNDNR